MKKADIEQYIKKYSVVSSKQIIKHFLSLGENSTRIRKAISRLQTPYNKLKFIHLSNNAQILYYKDIWKTTDFCNKVTLILREENSVYAMALDAIKARGGFIVEKYFPIISGSGEQKKHIWPNKIKDNLISAGLLTRDNNILYLTEYIDSIKLSVNPYCIQEQIILQLVEDWLKKLNFIAYKKTCHKQLSGDLPKFATTYWDITAPSYLLPLMQNNLQGSVLCDLFLNEITDISQIQYVMKKLELLSISKRIPKHLPIIIAPSFSKNAFIELKRNGIIPASFDNLFGMETAKLFTDLYFSLQNLAAAVTRDPNKVYTIFTKIAAFESISNQIRGPLFEMICVHYVHSSNLGYIENGKSIFCNKLRKYLEIDIINESPKEVFIVECKGYLPNHLIEYSEVKEWLSNIYQIRQELISTNQANINKKFIFNFWTSSDFTAEALSLLENTKDKAQFEIRWKNGENLKNSIKEKGLKGAEKMLKDYFFKNYLNKQLA